MKCPGSFDGHSATCMLCQRPFRKHLGFFVRLWDAIRFWWLSTWIIAAVVLLPAHAFATVTCHLVTSDVPAAGPNVSVRPLVHSTLVCTEDGSGIGDACTALVQGRWVAAPCSMLAQLTHEAEEPMRPAGESPAQFFVAQADVADAGSVAVDVPAQADPCVDGGYDPNATVQLAPVSDGGRPPPFVAICPGQRAPVAGVFGATSEAARVAGELAGRNQVIADLQGDLARKEDARGQLWLVACVAGSVVGSVGSALLIHFILPAKK